MNDVWYYKQLYNMYNTHSIHHKYTQYWLSLDIKVPCAAMKTK